MVSPGQGGDPHAMGRVWLLAFGSFAVGTGLFALGGVLPSLSEDLGVTQSAAGQSVTVFALTYAVTAPLAASVTGRWPTRAVLLVSLGVFTVGNALTAVASDLTLLFLSRVVAAVGAATFSPAAYGAAAAIVAASSRGRALAIVSSGLTGALAVGVPLGVVLSRDGTWRSAVVLVAVLGLAAIVVIAVGVRRLPPAPRTSLAGALHILRSGSVLVVLLITVLAVSAGMSAYTYIASVLDATVAPTSGQYLLLLVIYGVGAFAGSLAIGPLTDRFGADRAVLWSVAALVLALALVPFVRPVAAAAVLVLFWGAAFTAPTPPQQVRLLTLVPHDATEVVSFNASGVYLGQGLGAALGGLALSGGLAPRELPVLAAVLALVALVVHLAAVRRATRGAGTA